MKLLAEREVNEILVEAGARLCGSLVARGLVDELVVYFAPVLLGDAGRGMFDLPEIQSLADRVALEIVETRVVGDDWRVVAKISEK